LLKRIRSWRTLRANFTHTLWSLASSLLRFDAITLFADVLIEAHFLGFFALFFAVRSPRTGMGAGFFLVFLSK
jgi:hypothetical protein